MPYEKYSPKEVAARGEAIYDEHIRQRLTGADNGKFVIIDIETGVYEIDRDEVAATDRALKQRPDAVLYAIRVGSPTAHTMGVLRYR